MEYRKLDREAKAGIKVLTFAGAPTEEKAGSESPGKVEGQKRCDWLNEWLGVSETRWRRVGCAKREEGQGGHLKHDDDCCPKASVSTGLREDACQKSPPKRGTVPRMPGYLCVCCWLPSPA